MQIQQSRVELGELEFTAAASGCDRSHLVKAMSVVCDSWG